MDDLYVIELEPEVQSWLELLPDKQHRKVEEYAELLATLGPRTPMPFTRPLEEGVRAVSARKVCADAHGPAHTMYTRGQEGEGA